MKKRLLTVMGALFVIFVVGAYAAEPGTQEDPLITKSYIDSVVYPSLKFNVVDVPAGKTLVCSSGTEIILRMGSCVVKGSQKGGLSDVTMGFDLADGVAVQGNHLLITPLDDGRGVKTSTDCIFMIKGNYSVQ